MVDMPAMSPSMVPQGFFADLKAVLMRDTQAMTRVAKNPAYLGAGIGLYVLAQAGLTFNRWRAMQEANDLLTSFGLDVALFTPMDMILQGVFALVSGLLLLVIMYYVATRLFKGKQEIDLKGFMILYFFVISPGVLMAIPIVGILAGIWMLVLVFTMLMHVFGFTFWKALGVLLVSGLAGALIMGIAGSLLGVPGYSASFSYDTSY
jgi:hypothetical protein